MLPATDTRASQTATVAGPAYVSVMITRRATLSGLRVHVTVTPHRVGIGDGTVHSPTQAPVLTTRNVVVNAPPRGGSARRCIGECAGDPVDVTTGLRRRPAGRRVLAPVALWWLTSLPAATGGSGRRSASVGESARHSPPALPATGRSRRAP